MNHTPFNTSHGNRDSIALSAAFDWRENAGRLENDLDLNVSLTDSLGEGEGLSDDQSIDWTLRYQDLVMTRRKASCGTRSRC